MAIQKHRALLDMTIKSFSDRLFVAQARIESLQAERASTERALAASIKALRKQTALFMRSEMLLSTEEEGEKSLQKLDERIAAAVKTAEAYKQKIKEIESLADDESAERWIEKSLTTA